MPVSALPLGGTCRCTNIRFEISSAPILTAACHCRDCQRMTASAFSLTAMMPAADFRIIKGKPVEKSLPRSLRQHFYCPDCMTWIFTKIKGIDDRVNIRPTLCDDAVWAKPFIEMMTRDKLPWAITPAAHSFDGFPTAAELQRLLGCFARETS